MKFRSLKKELQDIFNLNDDDSKKRHAIQRYFISMIMFIIGLIMTFVNYNHKADTDLVYISVSMSLIGLIGQLLIINRKIKLSALVISLSFISISMYFIFTGGYRGFSILWCFMIPMGAFVLFGLKAGAIVNTFNCILLFIIFWTPLNQYIYEFNRGLLVRVPIVFFAMALFSFLGEWIRDKDFSELIKANSSLEELVYLDKTTGAPNFNKFQKDAIRLLEENKYLSYVMVAIDIVTFKLINDKHGYKFGNEILMNMADELRKICNTKEAFARESADRFAMLLSYEDKNLLEVRIMNINDRLKHCNHKYFIRLNLGIYRVEGRSLDIWTLYDRALMAKAISKKNELVDYSFYNEEIRKKLLNERLMEETMDSALLDKEFVVYYQPKYNLKKEKYCGAEALVRWHKPDGTVIPPNEFISFFEKKGFITKIDMFVLREVCIRMNKWRKEGRPPITVSVNISKMDFYNEGLLSDIIEIVDKYEIPHKYIELEMTETLAAENMEEFIKFSNRCRQAGFLVSMDDFGSGFSSLTMMKELDVDIIKLDKSMFSENIAEEKFNKGKVIIKHIIDLSKELNITVVAEGIETKEVVDVLKEMNCDIVQGYYFGKPMMVEKFEELLNY